MNNNDKGKTVFEHFKLSRNEIDTRINTLQLEQLTHISISILSQQWGNLYNNTRITKTMSERLLFPNNKIIIKDVVRIIAIDQRFQMTCFHRPVQSYFNFSLNIFSSNSLYGEYHNAFGLKIFTKYWYYNLWKKYVKDQQLQKSLFSKNIDDEIELVKKPITNELIKIKTSRGILNRVKKEREFFLSKCLGDTYNMIDIVLSEFQLNDIEELSNKTDIYLSDIKDFINGKNEDLFDRLIELIIANKKTIGKTIMSLIAKSRLLINKDLPENKLHELTDIFVNNFCIQYGELNKSPFTWINKRCQNTRNRLIFEDVVRYLWWLRGNFKNSFDSLFSNYINVILHHFVDKEKLLKDFKIYYLHLPNIEFIWQTKIFLSGASKSFWIADKFNRQIIVDGKVKYVDNRSIRLSPQKVVEFRKANKNCKKSNMIMLASNSEFDIIKQDTIKISNNTIVNTKGRLYSSNDIKRFKNFNINEIDELMIEESEKTSGDEIIDNKRFEQLMDVQEYIEKTYLL